MRVKNCCFLKPPRLGYLTEPQETNWDGYFNLCYKDEGTEVERRRVFLQGMQLFISKDETQIENCLLRCLCTLQDIMVLPQAASRERHLPWFPSSSFGPTQMLWPFLWRCPPSRRGEGDGCPREPLLVAVLRRAVESHSTDGHALTLTAPCECPLRNSSHAMQKGKLEEWPEPQPES